MSPVHTFLEDKWDAIIAVCLLSAFYSIKAALPVMLEQNWGRLSNTGSTHALVASPYKSAHNAAKHDVAGFPRSTEQDPEFLLFADGSILLKQCPCLDYPCWSMSTKR